MPQRRSPRMATFDYTGSHRYFWTICTFHRKQIFVFNDVVEPLVLQIQQHAEGNGVAISAYCFMPDHLHLLREGSQEHSQATRVIDRFKQTSGYWYSRRREGRLWQKYGWDRVLRSEEQTWEVI